MAAKHIRSVKIWVDDRRGTYPKMSPDDRRGDHRRGARAPDAGQRARDDAADQKEVVRDGADVLVHLVQNEKLDDEFLALLKEKKPYWATVIGLGDRTEVCEPDPFFEQSLPPSGGRARSGRRPRREAARAVLRPGVAQRREARGDRRLELPEDDRVGRAASCSAPTPACIPAIPSAPAIITSWRAGCSSGCRPPTRSSRRPRGRPNCSASPTWGRSRAGKSADFVVLDANPLDDIHNTRRIARVYLRGRMLDRDALLREMAGAGTTAPSSGGRAAQPRTHDLKLLPQNVHWGYYDAVDQAGAAHRLRRHGCASRR